MTCKEKLREQHAELDDEAFDDLIETSCPDGFGYFVDPDRCIPNEQNCDDCWNRELPEPKKGKKKKMDNAPVIKDSGNRRQFESGAVRDMQEGKGRFDLVPLEVMSDMLGTKEVNHDPVVLDIATFMHDHDTCWLYAAIENFAEKAYDGCLYTMLLEVAKHFEEGAKKYAENNWKRGIPAKCYIDSALRHYMKWCRGDKDEPHDRALVWNLMCCIWEIEYGEEWRKSGGSVVA